MAAAPAGFLRREFPDRRNSSGRLGPQGRSMFKQTLATVMTLATTPRDYAAPPGRPKASRYRPTKLRQGSRTLYWVTEGSGDVPDHGQGVIVVDAPRFGDKLLKAVAEVTKEPITYVIYSHAHADISAGRRTSRLGDLHRARANQSSWKAAGQPAGSMASSSAAPRFRCRPSPSRTNTR